MGHLPATGFLWCHIIYILSIAGLCFPNCEDMCASHKFGINEIIRSSGNIPKTDGTSNYEERIYDFFYSETLSTNACCDDYCGCDVFRESTINMLNTSKLFGPIHLECNMKISCHVSLVNSVDVHIVYIVRIGMQNMKGDNTNYNIIHSQYDRDINMFMRNFNFHPNHNAGEGSHEKNIFVALTNNQTEMPTASPTISDEPLFTMRLLMIFGVFLVVITLIISTMCYFSMRKSMNRIVVGIGQ